MNSQKVPLFDASNMRGSPWERQLCDTPKSFRAFCMYRDMGVDRSMNDCAARLKVTEKLLRRWSAIGGWVARVAAYDEYFEKMRRTEYELAMRMSLEDEARKTAALVSKAKQVALHDFEVLVKRAEKAQLEGGDDEATILDRSTLIKLLDRAVMLERVITGKTNADDANAGGGNGTREVIHRIVYPAKDPTSTPATMEASMPAKEGYGQ